jgi:hypothetical protein
VKAKECFPGTNSASTCIERAPMFLTSQEIIWNL